MPIVETLPVHTDEWETMGLYLFHNHFHPKPVVYHLSSNVLPLWLF